MDKNTLSNYGWIVIAVLVLAVMIALATPFGKYIESGVKSTTEGLFSTSENAMNTAFGDMGVQVEKPTFEDGYKTPNGGTTETPDVPSGPAFGDNKIEYGKNDPDLNHSGVIPEGGYYVDASMTEFTHDENFPVTKNGDVYDYGDYEYTYNERNQGWHVSLLDKTKSSYGAILESINGKPIIDMNCTFGNCTSLTVAPVIPSTVTNMYETFYNCKSLTTAPKIPNSVVNMNSTFYFCSLLQTMSAIPESVTNMHQTFYDCKSLTGTVTINANPTHYTDCFYISTVGKPLTLTGSSTMLRTLANTNVDSYRTIIVQ